MIRHTLTALCACVALTIAEPALAQGTATGPFTSHDVVDDALLGPTVFIGNDADPIEIDLDPDGQPWLKGIFDSTIVLAVGGVLDMVETIENVGTEPWTDWHEQIIDPPVSLPPAVWESVVSISVNGSPITFESMGEGTQELWLDTFSQLVQPGDILTIHKQANVLPNEAGMTGDPLMRILEYPTSTVPEPGTLMLLAVISLVPMGIRRRR